MKKRVISSLMTVVMLTIALTQNISAGFKIPDVGGMASDITSGISDAAGQAQDVISEKAQQAGEVMSGAANQAGEILSDVKNGAGAAVSGAAMQIGDIASGFASHAGSVVSEWGKQAGETADEIKGLLSDAGVTVQITAEQLGNATAKTVEDLTEKAGKATDDALGAVSGASDFVVDQAGHVVDLAAIGSEYVTSAAGEALKILKEQSSLLMSIAEDAVSDIDLSKQDNWEQAKAAVDDALSEAFDEGILKAKNEETIRIIIRIVFGSMMYSYQYTNGYITLGEYVSAMSEVLIKEGLPTGVGFIVSLLPFSAGHADWIAKQATYYLIALAYGDKPGDEIESEEDRLLEKASETELDFLAETEAETEKER